MPKPPGTKRAEFIYFAIVDELVRKLVRKLIAKGTLTEVQAAAVDEDLALLELIAEAADLLTFYQEVIASEAYLDTARRPQPLRRHALRRHLRRAKVALKALVSKYIGETEKNLTALFNAAEKSGVVLLFDEADALFGKRSEVKDSHDRYANIELGYLLQRVADHRGLMDVTKMRRARHRRPHLHRR